MKNPELFLACVQSLMSLILAKIETTFESFPVNGLWLLQNNWGLGFHWPSYIEAWVKTHFKNLSKLPEFQRSFIEVWMKLASKGQLNSMLNSKIHKPVLLKAFSSSLDLLKLNFPKIKEIRLHVQPFLTSKPLPRSLFPNPKPQNPFHFLLRFFSLWKIQNLWLFLLFFWVYDRKESSYKSMIPFFVKKQQEITTKKTRTMNNVSAKRQIK